jgi:hypothetical protein
MIRSERKKQMLEYKNDKAKIENYIKTLQNIHKFTNLEMNKLIIQLMYDNQYNPDKVIENITVVEINNFLDDTKKYKKDYKKAFKKIYDYLIKLPELGSFIKNDYDKVLLKKYITVLLADEGINNIDFTIQNINIDRFKRDHKY